MISRAFTPRMIASMEPHIQQVTDELFDVASARGELELMADIANALPVIVIAEILGVPRNEYAKFKTCCDGFVAGQTNPPGMPTPTETHENPQGAFAIPTSPKKLRSTEEAKLANDLLGIVVAAEEAGGETLTPDKAAGV